MSTFNGFKIIVTENLPRDIIGYEIVNMQYNVVRRVWSFFRGKKLAPFRCGCAIFVDPHMVIDQRNGIVYMNEKQYQELKREIARQSPYHKSQGGTWDDVARMDDFKRSAREASALRDSL